MTRKIILITLLLSIPLILTALLSDDSAPTGHQIPVDGPSSILLLAAGDIMVHDRQLESAYRREAQSYDFSEWFAPLQPYLREGDLVVGNLETTLAGENLYFSGYPAFNSPESLAVDLKEAGFHVVSTANNHCLDRGERGIVKTIEHLEAAGLYFFGTARTREERDRFLTLRKNGITVVFLAYTYGTNGIPIPEGKDYMVNMLEEDLIRRDIKKARDQADLLVVSLHWGHEYQREPYTGQQKLAEKIIGWGADLILGSHPHVLQPVEFIRTPSGREGVVAHSLGNLVSDQMYPYTDSGLILRVRYVKDADGVRLSEINCVPTWVHRYYPEGRLAYRVLAVADALYLFENGKDPYLSASNYRHLQEVWRETRGIIWLDPYSLQANYRDTILNSTIRN